jgi:hypothetical protein
MPGSVPTSNPVQSYRSVPAVALRSTEDPEQRHTDRFRTPPVAPFNPTRWLSHLRQVSGGADITPSTRRIHETTRSVIAKIGLAAAVAGSTVGIVFAEHTSISFPAFTVAATGLIFAAAALKFPTRSQQSGAEMVPLNRSSVPLYAGSNVQDTQRDHSLEADGGVEEKTHQPLDPSNTLSRLEAFLNNP